MITSLTTQPTRAPQQRPVKSTCPDEVRGEFPFELSVLDTGREMYFLPQMDRLAALLASESHKPMQVRLEAENQVIEYVVTEDPAATIEANLNGKPFVMSTAPAEDGSLALTGHSEPGEFEGNFYLNPDGSTQVTGLAGPNRMPVNHSLWRVKDPKPGDPVIESLGNFACARMSTAYYPEGENLHLLGNMGVHNIEGMLTREGEGWKLEGDYGDMKFRQTFTPLQK